jgi:hypothetical protein
VRDGESLSDIARIVDVLTGAARAFAMGRRAVVIQLHGHADDVIAIARHQSGYDAGIDPAGHRDDDARVLRRFWQTQGVQRRGGSADAFVRNMHDCDLT